ncbi:hypothetical protein VCHA44O286_50268 [Vibrio chagasii]|nr:hypothetical protein VCHA44O286_50268 [Vibrio chagasii]
MISFLLSESSLPFILVRPLLYYLSKVYYTLTLSKHSVFRIKINNTFSFDKISISNNLRGSHGSYYSCT